MTFSEGGNFEGGRVQRGGGGGRIGGRGIAIGGGGIGAIVIAVIYLMMGGNPADLVGGGTSGSGGYSQQQEDVGTCTAEQANTDQECRLSATAQALDAYWAQALPEQAGIEYVPPGVTSFSGAVDTGCGSATSATGPFYCPADQTVYEDVSFYAELERMGATGGNLSEMYVTAHEFGHHIENQLGWFERADRSGTGAESDSVRIELAADCLAGMWVGHAATTVDPDTGVTFLEPISKQELNDAISAAEAVGDDSIQENAGMEVNPEAFTHGTSEQRVDWFTRGYQGGTIQECNALEAARL